MKQNCRNVLGERPELLAPFFMLSVRDALSYDANTNEGGPNGSLRFELEDSSNADVRAAAAAIADIRKLQREDMSFADTCAFAGATAIEVAGGPRIKVQLGREDAPVPDAPGKGRLFTSTATASELYSCFENAGLQPARDIVLIHGAVGALNAIAKARLEVLAREDDEMDEEDVTYGRVTGGKRGAVLVATNVSDLTLGGAKFSNQYLKALLKRDAKELGAMDATILQSDEMKAEVAKYAGSNSKFINDLGDLFQRVTLLGTISCRICGAAMARSTDEQRVRGCRELVRVAEIGR